MSIKKIIVVLLCLIAVTGCSNEYTKKYTVTKEGLSSTKVKDYKEINFKEFEEKVKNEDSFVVLLWQTGCQHCEAFDPKLKKVVKALNLEVYSMNVKDLSEDERSKLENKTFMTGTPTLVYLYEGINDSKIVGNKSEEEILDFFVEIGYLKEK